MVEADPSKQRIISVDLDESSIVWRNPDVEQERRVAIFDLLEDNKFVPQRGHDDGYAGPYRLKLRVEDGRLIFEIAREDGSDRKSVVEGKSVSVRVNLGCLRIIKKKNNKKTKRKLTA